MKRFVRAEAGLIITLALGVFYQSAVGDVIVEPWSQPEITNFPHDTPPDDLEPGEAGDERPELSVPDQVSHNGAWDNDTSTYTVTSLGDISMSGYTEIRLPDNAPQALKDHEDGHDALNGNEWSRAAKKKMEAAMLGPPPFVGMSFSGEGADPAARQSNAVAKATTELNRRIDNVLAAISNQMGILADNYDKKTDHGLNPTPSANEAVDLVIKERDNAPKAGEQHDVKPDDSKDKGKTTEHGSGMLFEPGRGQFSFGGDLTIVSASDPADTVCGRGIVNIQPLYFIGQQKNGTYLLSDTSLQIFDVQTSNVLMCAYLYELAYMPSSLPGYAGMIQGYLDIPPEIPPGYGGGVSNSIGSSFLSDMQAASASGLPTTFWAFTASSLLDAQGNLQTDSIPTTIVLGVATPSLNPTNIIWQVTGTQLTLSWPVDHIGWRLQAQTNSLSTRLGANWFDMAGSSTTNRFIITMTPANGAVFYRLVYSN